MTQYIPYSIRNNITDPDLAGLLDYLERQMGWEMRHTITPDLNMWQIFQENGDEWGIHNTGDNIHFLCNQEWRMGVYRPAFREMIPEVFFRTYKSIIPVIRDLYRKK